MSCGLVEVRLVRMVDEACACCHGCGELTYGSTSTWRGGIGGQAMTSDVCDHCWGSGDSAHPWTDLRKLGAERAAEVDRLAAHHFERTLGAGLRILSEAQLAIAAELDVISRKRKSSWDTRRLAERLASALREYSSSAQKP